jgi:hypothetical protein
VTLALVVVALPWIAASLMGFLPPGRVAAWIDLGSTAVTAGLACAALGQDDAMLPPFRVDELAVLFMALIALSAAARRWANLHRRRRTSDRRAAGQAMLGGMLLACLLADPLLCWLALAAATAAALYPALPRGWDGVPLAGAGLGLALFGIIAIHADPMTRPTVAVIALAGLILGYALLAGLLPGLLILLLALLLRLRGLSGESTAVGPMLIALGIAASLACGGALICRPDSVRRVTLLRLGQGGVAVAAFGLGGTEAVFAGLVQVALLALAGAAADMGGRTGPERVAIAAGLGGLPPLGVFPGLALIAAAVAHQSAWLLLPLGVAVAMMGWATIVRLPSPRWNEPIVATPVWVPLGLILLIGWLLPAGAADWLHAAAAGVP